MMNKWFTRYLYGVENGVEQRAEGVDRARGQRGDAAGAAPAAPGAAAGGRGRGRAPIPPPTPYADYPNPEAVVRHAAPAQPAAATHRRCWRSTRAANRAREKLIDDVALGGPALAAAAAVEPSPDLRDAGARRRRCTSRGRARVTVRLASSKPAANLSVWLVVLPWTEGPIGPDNLITRGWADPQNRALAEAGRQLRRDRAAASRSCRAVLHADLRPAARRPDRSGRQAHRPDDLLERSRLHAVAVAGHRADDRPRRDVAAAPGRRRPHGVRASAEVGRGFSPAAIAELKLRATVQT